MVLKKELALYERNKDGELIPQEVPLQLAPRDAEEYPDLAKEKIAIIPMTRGDITELFSLTGKADETAPETSRDTDAELVVKYCKNPSFTAEEAKFMKPVYLRSIVRTIMVESGIKFDDKKGTKRADDNDELGKNS